MSRFEESKIIEHDERIEHIEVGIKALKEEKESLPDRPRRNIRTLIESFIGA